MMNLYHKKGGKKEFNCEYIRITEEDLDNLVEYEKNNKDFNIEYSRIELNRLGDDIKTSEPITNLARKALNDGYALYYVSWW